MLTIREQERLIVRYLIRRGAPHQFLFTGSMSSIQYVDSEHWGREKLVNNGKLFLFSYLKDFGKKEKFDKLVSIFSVNLK